MVTSSAAQPRSSQQSIFDFFRRSAKAESADDSSGPAQSTAVSSSPAIVQDALPSLEGAKRWLEASEQENGVLTSPQKRLKVAVDAISMSSCREQRELIQTLCGPHEWNIKQKERGQKRNIEQLRSALEREVVCFYGALKKKRTIAQMTAQARATEANVPNTASDHSDPSANPVAASGVAQPEGGSLHNAAGADSVAVSTAAENPSTSATIDTACCTS